MLRVITINFLVLLGFLVLLEMVFGTWFSDVHALHQFTKPRDLKIERQNPLSEDPPFIVYSRDKNGFRGMTGETSQIDMITVGGSTTDQRFLDDSQTYQASLKKLFAQDGRALVIANAGIDGQTTFGHIENFASWFDLIGDLEARFILFYVGVNDALIVAQNESYDTLAAHTPRLRLQLFVREKSAFYQLYLIAKQAYLTPNVAHAFGGQNFAVGNDLVTAPNLPSQALVTPEIQDSLAALTDRVKELAQLSRAMGSEPIFVTQRSTAWTRSGSEIVGVRTIEPGFHTSLVQQFGVLNGIDIYNIERGVADAILKGCRVAEAMCLDLMNDVAFDLEADFYDEVHTTSDGSQKIAAYLYEKLIGTDAF